MSDNEKPDSLTSALTGILDETLASEVIGGSSIADVLEFVDLDVAFSPVIELPAPSDSGPMPRVTEVQKWPDGRYAIVTAGEAADYTIIPEDLLKIMRARYLLHHKARQRIAFSGFVDGLKDKGHDPT